jgi:hypothetical protein
MKKFRISGAALALVALFTVSCSQWIDPTVNIDPNNPKDAALTNLLLAAQVSVGYTFGGDLNRYSSLLTQHNIGIDRQHGSIYNYKFLEGDVNTLWNNYYQTDMNNIKIIIDKGTETTSPHYRGVARVLMAMTLGSLTDAYGDVPYSKALQGNGLLQVPYDKQEALYTEIQSLLDGAIVDLGATVSSLSPSATDDIIFGGGATGRQRWIRAAWMLKARYALHLSKLNNTQAAQQALTFAAKGLQSAAEDIKVTYITGVASNANPLQQFDSQRGDIRVHPNFMTLLNRLNDPRKPLIVRTVSGDTTALGTFHASTGSPVFLGTYAEQKFIEAEANLSQGNADAAKTAFTAGVRASLTTYGVAAAAIDTYVAQPSVVPAGAITLDRIMEQKYIALYMSNESWLDWRRTGLPTIRPVAGNAVPRRFPYPQNERLYNAANWAAAGGSLDQSVIFNRVWWDK